LGDALRAGVRGEVVEPDLDPDRATAVALLDERLAELAGELLEHGLEGVQAAQVRLEGGLARLRLGDAHGLDLTVVLEAGEPRQVRSEAPAEHLRQFVVGSLGELAQRFDAAGLEALRSLRPDARHKPRRLRAEAL